MIADIQPFQATTSARFDWPCMTFRPEGAPPPHGWPAVIFLHGAGEKGVDGAALAQGPVVRAIGAGLAIQAVVVCPQCPPGAGWPVEGLEVLLDRVASREDVDARSVHMTGISMGARGAWDLAYRRAADLAGLVVVAGLGVPNLAPIVGDLPVWLIHGQDDEVVPIARAGEMAAALDAAQGRVRFTPLPDTPHDCGDRVFADPAMWRWMLDNRRPERNSE